jgi:hypothetical protein
MAKKVAIGLLDWRIYTPLKTNIPVRFVNIKTDQGTILKTDPGLVPG